jgi:hypothetical protein
VSAGRDATKKAAADPAEYVELRGRLADQLGDLRAMFQEAVASYSVRVQGTLADVGDMLAGDEPGSLSRSELAERVATMREALERVRGLDLRPAKGRRRDLKAVQELADELSGTLSEW